MKMLDRNHIAKIVSPDAGHDMVGFIDFVEKLMSEFNETIELCSPNPCFQMSLELLRRHLEGKQTHSSLLIDTSGVPYATGVRRLKEMIAAGLIEQRPRTSSGKTFLLYPSQKLLEQWQQMSSRVERMIEGAGNEIWNRHVADDYYFGESYLRTRAIPPMQAISDPVTLSGGVKILAHGDPTFMVMENLKRQMESALGCTIQQRAFSIDRLHEEHFRNAKRTRSLYDIVAVNLPWIGEFVENDLLLPLDDVLDVSELDPADFHPATWQAVHWGGRCFGVPAHSTSELLFYRRDLFEERRIATPKTTEEMIDAAAKLHNSGSGNYGIAWNAARGTPLGHTFLMAMADFGMPVIDLPRIAGGYDTSSLASGAYRVNIDSIAGRRAAEFLIELLQYSPPDILSMSWFERIRCYASGQASMAFGFTNMLPYFENEKRSPANGNTGFLPHPTGSDSTPIAPVGGYFLGIPRNIPRERIFGAVKSLALLTSPQAQKLYIMSGSRGSPRYSVGDDPEVRKVSPIFEAIDNMSRRDELQSWPRPPIPEIDAITQICGTELHDMLRGLCSVEDALKRAQEQATQLIKSRKHK